MKRYRVYVKQMYVSVLCHADASKADSLIRHRLQWKKVGADIDYMD